MTMGPDLTAEFIRVCHNDLAEGWWTCPCADCKARKRREIRHTPERYCVYVLSKLAMRGKRHALYLKAPIDFDAPMRIPLPRARP
jgi:hypothetical protein